MSLSATLLMAIIVSIELPVQGWRFNGSSFIQYRTQFRRPITWMTLTITFNPHNDTGLVLFASRNKNGTGPYILVQLDEGIQFGINTGAYKTLLRFVFCIFKYMKVYILFTLFIMFLLKNRSPKEFTLELKKWQTIKLRYISSHNYATLEHEGQILSHGQLEVGWLD